MINISRITFRVLTFRVIVEARSSSRSCLKFRGGNDDINWILLRKYNFRGHFVCLSFARWPRKNCPCVSHEMGQFVRKIAHLTISMEPTPLIEKVSKDCLIRRLLLLVYCCLLPFIHPGEERQSGAKFLVEGNNATTRLKNSTYKSEIRDRLVLSRPLRLHLIQEHASTENGCRVLLKYIFE